MQLTEYETGAVGDGSKNVDPTNISRGIDPGSEFGAATDLSSGSVVTAVKAATPEMPEAAVLDGHESGKPADTGSPATEGEPERTSPSSAPLEPAGDAVAKPREDDAIRVVRAFMARRHIEILFDGTMRCTTQPQMALTPDAIESYLSKVTMNPTRLIDEIMVEMRAGGRKMPQADLVRALRIIKENDQNKRKLLIACLIMQPLPEEAMADAAREWERLTDCTFETNGPLIVAIWMHFIWQVKRKLLGLPVSRHLMPIVYSPVQGSGKTTFVRRFLEPLQELAIKSRISEFVDSRNIEIYRFPVLVIDDMEKIQPSRIPDLKDLMANEDMSRRPLRTSGVAQVAQSSTLIGTANNTVDELVSDRTGNRRFVGLPFRNGEVTKGGDDRVWKTVGAADYLLLWRSVDVFGPSPIEAHLGALIELQESGRVHDELETWLCELDVNSAEVQDIVEPHGVPAGQLFEFFRKQTGSTMTSTRFGTDMNRHVADPAVPFGPKRKIANGTVYPLKPRTLGA